VDELTTGTGRDRDDRTGNHHPSALISTANGAFREDGAFREELTSAAVQIIQAMCCGPDDPVAAARLTAAAAAVERARRATGRGWSAQ
jgi:hypothetical protein